MKNRHLANAILGFVSASTTVLVILNFYALALVLFSPIPSAAQEQIVGIGVKLGIGEVSLVNEEDEKIVSLGMYVDVVEVLPGSPAKTVGLMAGDSITAINGKSVRQMSKDEIINAIRGEEGTYVTINVSRLLKNDGEIDPNKYIARYSFSIRREKNKTN